MLAGSGPYPICLQIGGNYLVKLIEEYKRDRTIEDEPVLKLLKSNLWACSASSSQTVCYNNDGTVVLHPSYKLRFFTARRRIIYSGVIRCVVYPCGEMHGTVTIGSMRMEPFEIMRIDKCPMSTTLRILNLIDRLVPGYKNRL